MQSEFKTISMIGLGYIGLPTAAVLASRGIDVIGVDVNEKAVNTINKGEIHIVEPELDVLVRGAVAVGKLRAVMEPEAADAFLIAVPTPFKGDHEPDLSYVEASMKAIARVLRKNNLVILESTSPVGTTDMMSEWLAKERPDLTFPHQVGEDADIQLAYCPERVLPGKVVKELVENDRVVGGMTTRCAQRAAALYRLFVDGECIITDARTAEMAKLTENSFRDVNIAFANELSLICDKLNINVWDLIRLSNRHPRVNILTPGPGVGGHCIAVDPWFIVDSSPKESRLIRVAREVNDGKPDWVIEKVREAIEFVENPVIACFGLSFKPNIDDLRESPALQIASNIAKEWPNSVVAVEPNITSLPKRTGDAVKLVSIDEAFASANIFLLLVKHREFELLDFSKYRIIDTIGIMESC